MTELLDELRAQYPAIGKLEIEPELHEGRQVLRIETAIPEYPILPNIYQHRILIDDGELGEYQIRSIARSHAEDVARLRAGDMSVPNA